MKNNKPSLKTQLLCLLVICISSSIVYAQTDNVTDYLQQLTENSRNKVNALNKLLGNNNAKRGGNACGDACAGISPNPCQVAGSDCTLCGSSGCQVGSGCGDPCLQNLDCNQAGSCTFCSFDTCIVDPFPPCPNIALQADGFTTTVNNSAELVEAIECSNLNGSNLDTINLSVDITLDQHHENNFTFGATATPVIETNLLIDGQNHSLIRQAGLNCTLDGSISATEFRLLRSDSGINLTLRNIVLMNGCSNGINSQGFGGALYNQANLTLNNVVFKQNQALEQGGAVYHTIGALNLINNSFFDHNSANFGGGVFSNSSISVIQNSTFSENSSIFNGSALFTSSTIAEINNVTLADNTGAAALGFENGVVTLINNSSFINNDSAVHNSFGSASIGTITNTIFHNNTSDCNGVTLAASANNLNNGSLTSCGTLTSSGVVTNLAPSLADNGCTTNLPDGTCLPTYALLTGSNAIDASASGTANDARGFISGNTRDIGAYEYQKPPVGVAKDITVNGTQITMDFYLENFSSAIANNVTLVDDLDTVFGSGNYTITVSPIFIADPSTITLNTSFDGSADTNIITSGTLAIAATAQIRIVVVVDNVIDVGAGSGNYSNQAVVTAQNSNSVFVSDLSDDGNHIDADSNNNPSGTNEDDKSMFTVDPSTPVELMNYSIESPK